MKPTTTTSGFVKQQQSATSSATTARQRVAIGETISSSPDASLQSRLSTSKCQQQQLTSQLSVGGQRQLRSLVLNGSVTGDSSYEQQAASNHEQQQQRRRHLLAAEFADDSLRSQTGGGGGAAASSGYGTPPSFRQVKAPAKARSYSLNSLEQQSRNPKEAPERRDSDNSSLSDESQHLMTTTLNTSATSDLRGCNACRHQQLQQHRHQKQQQQQQQRQQHADSKLSVAGSCNCCACFASKRELEAKRKAAILEQMSTSAQTTKLIPAYFIAELIGTFLLVVIGDGAVAAYVLTRRQVDVFCVCLAFGTGAMIGTYASAKISGAHLNPAATLANALQGKLKWSLVPVYMVAQYLGSFLAALVLLLNYSEAINSLDGGDREANGTPNATGSIFATYPAPYVTVWGSLMDQIVGTAVLLFAISAVCDTKNRAMDERQQPLVVALVIGLVCVAFSPNCGAIFNPARDLSPRLVTALFGYSSVWEPIEGTYWVVAAIVGPHIGAIIGVFAYDYLIGSALCAFERHAQQMADIHDGQHEGIVCHSITEKPPRQQQLQQMTPIQQPGAPSMQPRLNDYGAAR